MGQKTANVKRCSCNGCMYFNLTYKTHAEFEYALMLSRAQKFGVEHVIAELLQKIIAYRKQGLPEPAIYPTSNVIQMSNYR